MPPSRLRGAPVCRSRTASYLQWRVRVDGGSCVRPRSTNGRDSRGCFQDRDGHSRLLNAHQPAAVLLQCKARLLHLAGARLAAQLRHQFVYLAETRGTNGMPLRFQPPGRVERDSPAHGGCPARRHGAAIPEIKEAKILALLDLAERRRIMTLDDINILGADPGNRIGLFRRTARNVYLNVLWIAPASIHQYRGTHLDGPVAIEI